MKRFISGFLIGMLIFNVLVFAREKLNDFSEQSIPIFNENILKKLWFAIDDLTIRKFSVSTIQDGDTTPDVSSGNFFITSANTGATAISDLDNPRTGQIVVIIGGSAANSSTIADAGNFNLTGAFTAGLDDVIGLYVQADNDYIELFRSNN